MSFWEGGSVLGLGTSSLQGMWQVFSSLKWYVSRTFSTPHLILFLKEAGGRD